ncbi:Serpentine Receptor, class E (Epsilon) [Caenorhabditis elegans]|uniref:Serpentine Receptor, class E (Epsilon) n=1 Tax=Caenorhabditis elegans TaxID=6239 RepID=A3QMB0_CAEEL|nr:Serpentine Receptor, class E (Epsilon) [Caenorhabditis elegans]CAM36342.1 Serpentine Receptor, class E (Epsilon) [Caenorhabditis elegans]|eukprot:NP_502328.2 Serpentine Receptor, class E (epsilon) [Caenorhabditis elegans]
MILSFNYTAAQEDNTLEYFNLGFVIIIFINIVSILYYLVNVSIDIRIGKFDTNVIKIHQFIYITCPIGSIVMIAQKVMIIAKIPGGYDYDYPTFQFLHHLRTSTVFPGLICLTAFVIERFLATLYLKDYERKNRWWIGIIIGIGLYTAGGLLAYSLAIVATSFYHTVFLLVLSATSCLGNMLNYKINQKYYRACQQSYNGKYCLAERYQISDNIHFYFFFIRFASSIFFFTILCPVLMLVASFEIDWFYRNLCITLFELSFSVYTILTPYIIYKFNIRWHQEFKRVLSKITARFKTKRIDVTEIGPEASNLNLRNTFGVEMNIDIKRQSDTYFEQLNSSWSMQKPCL